MKRFKHSGAFGDLIYSLPIMKYLGGGEFYLHLNQINWIGQHYYGSTPDPFHQGRLTEQDFEFIRSLLEAQPYVSKCDILSPSTEITHNLDRFRPLFVGHPGNYVDIYAVAFGITDPVLRTSLRNTPWLEVPNTRVYDNASRTIAVNRTLRWIPQTPGQQWQIWKEQGMESQAFFVGLPNEYQEFKKQIGWDIPYQPAASVLELAEYIAGSQQFIGNQSMALSLAIGLGTKFHCELRTDLPQERNECWFKDHPNGSYF
jgi:hypothetical protein